MTRSPSNSEIDMMPVLFIGHGSPMNMVLSNTFTKSLVELGKSLPQPESIMVISAHWLTRGSYVTCVNQPRMIYDFYGFPEELYRVTYNCPGAPDVATNVTRLASGSFHCDKQWGIDHAAYSVMRHMFPSADIPVFELSLDYSMNDWNPKPIRYHYDLAKNLKPLRNQGVLIVGSGNIVHNLGLIDFANMNAIPPEWALEADNFFKSNLSQGDHSAIIEYPRLGGIAATRAIPTLDHYLPMIYCLALQEKNEQLQFTYEGFQNGSISMRSFLIG